MQAMLRPRLPLVELKPAPRLAALLVIAHLSALFLLATVPLATPLLALAAAGLVISAGFSVTRHALRRGARAVTALEFTDRERVRVRLGDGSWLDGRLLGSSTLGTVLTVLNVRTDHGGTVHVAITGDGIDHDDFRRLRVWLRWGPRPAGVDAEPS